MSSRMLLIFSERELTFAFAICRRPSVCLSVVCPSVCRLSVTFVHHTQTIKIFGNIFISYKRSFILVLWEEELLVGATPSTWNCGSTYPRWSEIANFQPIFARSSLAVTPSEKSLINTNRKTTTRFAMSLRWSSYVAPKSPKGGSKTQKGRFPCKIALRLKKVCYKVPLCENCQRQSCKAFNGLTDRAKMTGGTDPLYLKFWIKVDRVAVTVQWLGQ